MCYSALFARQIHASGPFGPSAICSSIMIFHDIVAYHYPIHRCSLVKAVGSVEQQQCIHGLEVSIAPARIDIDAPSRSLLECHH